MTIMEALGKLDSSVHNTYEQEDKIGWLSKVDGLAKQVMEAHEGDDSTFTGYDGTTPLSTMLLIPEPYTEAYLRYMEAQIHFLNKEYDHYNNAISMFSVEWNRWKAFHTRTHMPKGTSIKYF